ncbi:SDR family NAD(P)-dependent oxidoreductase [Rhodopila sp.]|uniref:SDR family NAD(P)-dependent oxidoreductase n=1 Tax=Rhodopila sp. TaxID=2480087 RepID=UPI003D0ABFCD
MRNIQLALTDHSVQFAALLRINLVHPGYADTPLTEKRFGDPAARQVLLDRTPMGRLRTAEDIANGVLFLASDESSWVTGSELVIDGHDGAVSAYRSTVRPRR